MDHSYPQLFSPMILGGRRLPNRLALPATLTNYAAQARVTPRWTRFLVERARGGTALIVSEIIAVDPEALAHGAIVAGHDEANEEGFRATAKAVEAAGSTLVGQLWHPGRQQLWHPTRSPQGVSDQPDALSWTVPHVMSTTDIRRLVEAFIATARRLQRCGFHGVELHGAHGYLLTQFLSPWSNSREDEFGGCLENRARFVVEVTDGIRDICGKDFIVGLKMPADEGVEGGITPDEAERLTTHLCRHGALDYLAYSQGNFSLSLENHVPDMHFEPGHFLHLHKRMRAVAGAVPVMALGRIGSPKLAEQVVADGIGDLVGLSRALISDAAFAAKARDGREHLIRPCVFNNSCWGEVHAGKPLAEFHNVHLAEEGEADWKPSRAAKPRHVVVVGAGPGGLEAAWVAAARGHRVTLIGSSKHAGGKLRLEARLPGHGEMAKVYEYQERLARDHGVRLQLGKLASAASILAESPDQVVLATGANMRRPSFLQGHDRHVHSAREFADRWDSDGTVRRGTAVLYDHDHTAATYALAEALAGSHRQAVLITPRTHIAQGVNYCSALGVFRRLYGLGVYIVTASEPVKFEDRCLWVRNVFSGEEEIMENVSTFVFATPRRANDVLARELAGSVPVRIIGDAMAPRDLLIAVHEGHQAALDIDPSAAGPVPAH